MSPMRCRSVLRLRSNPTIRASNATAKEGIDRRIVNAARDLEHAVGEGVAAIYGDVLLLRRSVGLSVGLLALFVGFRGAYLPFFNPMWPVICIRKFIVFSGLCGVPEGSSNP